MAAAAPAALGHLPALLPSHPSLPRPAAQAALDAHNAARTARGAAALVWNDTLAQYALGVSQTCKFEVGRAWAGPGSSACPACSPAALR